MKLSNDELDQLIYAMMAQVGDDMEFARLYYRTAKDQELLGRLEAERDARQ